MKSSLRHLRLADLELFITAAHLKNLSRAAAIHHLSQSAASAAIQRVENAFGQQLCHHEKRHFRLTHEGMILLPKAEDWLKQFRGIVANQMPRPIRLVTTHAIARVAIPAILTMEPVDLQLMRPDHAYGAVLRDEADMAFVPNNAPWEGLIARAVGQGLFQLYSSHKDAPLGPILLPENQIEVLSFIQRWNQSKNSPLEIKARIPSWSLIADICATTTDVGFLPDFLAKKVGLSPVSWQPEPSQYQIIALYQKTELSFEERLNRIIDQCQSLF